MGIQLERKQPGGAWAGALCRKHRGRAASGFILGVLFWIGATELGIEAIPPLRSQNLFLLAGLLGSLAVLSRGRAVLWLASGAVCVVWLLVCDTPLVGSLVREARSDPLERVDAVVVLSSDIRKDGSLPDQAQRRLLQGYRVLRQGYARRLVLTRPAPPVPSCAPAVSRQMSDLGFDYPIEETEPIWNTHDEAVATLRLARKRGWERVILVTDRIHMHRAAATFEKAGLRVLCSPSGWSGDPEKPRARAEAFRDWIWEAVGYQIYRLRGWV